MIFVQDQPSVSRSVRRVKAAISKERGGIILFLLCLFPLAVRAQPDTIPVLLQPAPLWHSWNVGELAARGIDTVILTSSGSSAGIWLSPDRGLTFNRRDSTVVYPTFICVPNLKAAGQASYSPIWQLDSSSEPEFSTDDGLSWLYPAVPQKPQQGSVTADGVSAIGDLFWYATSQHIILTHSFGSIWDTLPFTTTPGYLSFYDANHGIRFLSGKVIAHTSDGGATWDTITLPGLVRGPLSYLTPNILYAAPASQFPLINFVSVDTGHTWKTINAFYDLSVVRDSLWYGMTTRGSVPNISNSLNAYYRSTDQGNTWKQFSYLCPNGPTYLLFADADHGVSVGTSQTDDGGYTWDCQDTTTYAAATQYIIPADFDASSYYNLSYLHGTNYVCLSMNRGASWAGLFPYPTNVPSGAGAPPWAVSLGERLYIAFPDKIIWTENLGQTFDTLIFSYPGSATGYIQRTPDGTLWASNDLELYVSNDAGNTWTDQSYNIPYRNDSFQLSYTFKPVDSLTGFVRTSSGAIFRTTNAGVTWQPDSLMPSTVVDSRHWFTAQNSKFTSNAGATWRAVSGAVSVAVDSERWLGPGRYTSDAGTTWIPIPGWRSSPAFVAVDSGTAFAGGFPNGAFWRLDMPFYGTPKPTFDFSVDDQTWQDVPLAQDTGWVQLPVVVHNKSVSASIQVTFDSVTDMTHFYRAPYQSGTVTVPKKDGFFGPDGLDSVWFIYHPTAVEQDDAKAYWHSPQVVNGEGKVLPRSDSLHGNATSASVAVSDKNNVTVTVSPDPATDLISIRGASGQVTVMNALGETVLTSVSHQITSEGAITLDFSRLPAGTYYARIEVSGRIVLRKIVKE